MARWVHYGEGMTITRVTLTLITVFSFAFALAILLNGWPVEHTDAGIVAALFASWPGFVLGTLALVGVGVISAVERLEMRS